MNSLENEKAKGFSKHTKKYEKYSHAFLPLNFPSASFQPPANQQSLPELFVFHILLAVSKVAYRNRVRET